MGYIYLRGRMSLVLKGTVLLGDLLEGPSD